MAEAIVSSQCLFVSITLGAPMTWIVLRDAFDQPFRVAVVNGEVTAKSDQAPVELVFTAASARATAERLLRAASQVDFETSATPPAKRPPDPA